MPKRRSILLKGSCINKGVTESVAAADEKGCTSITGTPFSLTINYILYSMLLVDLGIPLASNHLELVVADSAEIGDHVVAAVDVR